MAYYAFLIFGIALLAAAIFLFIKMLLKLIRIKKAQKKETADHPEARKVFTEKGTVMMDAFIIIAFTFMAIMEYLTQTNTPDQTPDNPGLILIMRAIVFFYLAQVIKTIGKGTLILGRHFFMNEDQTYRFRDIRKSEEYRRRIFLHFKDGKVAELSYIQAEAVEEARKKSGNFKKR